MHGGSSGEVSDENWPLVRLSSFCSDGGCVGVVLGGDGVSVVDTKADGAGLRFTHEEWGAFVAGVKNGEFDLD